MNRKRSTYLLLLLLLFGVGTCSYRSRDLFTRGIGGFLMTSSLGTSETVETPVAPLRVEETIVTPPVKIEKKLRIKKVALKKKPVKVASAEPTSVSDANLSESVATARAIQTAISLGVHAGTNYLFPVVRLERVIGTQIALVAHATFTKNLFPKESATVYGGGVSGSYFLRDAAPYGPFVDLGLSMYSIEGSNSIRTSSATPGVLSSTLGWSLAMFKGFDATLSAGGQYVYNWKKNVGDIDFNGLMPLFKISIGYGF